MRGQEVRTQLEYTILTDFILSNTDRHYNNFGFLYSSAEHRLVKMAPIYDTGNCLFYEEDLIPLNSQLLNIKVNSFRKKEAELLSYVQNKDLIDLQALQDFPEEVEELLRRYTEMPEERLVRIAETVRRKMGYLQLFQEGKKI